MFKSSNEEAMRGREKTMNAVTGGNRGGGGGGFGGGFGGGYGGGFGSGGAYSLFIDLHLHLQSVSSQDLVLVGAVAQCEGAALA